jgi:lysine decarboxylase
MAVVDAGTTAFHVPGHKRGRGGSAELHRIAGPALHHDVWLETGAYADARHEAERLAALAWGAKRAFLLGNGSTAGNQAFLLASVGHGDEVVVSRDLHVSTLTGLVMTGARPVYVQPRLHPELDLGLGIHPDDLDRTLRAHPHARLISLVSPGYSGVVSDTRGLAAVARRHGVPLFLDEAWGAHLAFHPDLPPHAMAVGADAAVTSVHKTLPAMSSGSLLMTGPGIDADRVDAAVRMTQTTSPLLPLLASIDLARRDLVRDGRRLVERAVGLAAAARAALRRIPGLDVLDAAALDLPEERLDPLKLVVDVTGLGMTGLTAEARLRRELALAPEGSDLRSVFLVVALGDDETSIARLVHAFQRLAERAVRARVAVPRSCGEVLAPVPAPLTPQEAWQRASLALPLTACVGELSAELVVPYPPGIPILAPGELVTAATVAYLQEAVACGVHVHGTADEELTTLRVVAG